MDNDLMARRLRPPSEPPRPQNGHSPLPPETPPWATLPESGAEVPWDRPAPEPWPPTTGEATADPWDAAPATHSWSPAPNATQPTPPTPDIPEAVDNTQAVPVTADHAPDTGGTTDEPTQSQRAPWDTETAPIWGGPAPWDPQPMTQPVTLQSDAVAAAEPPSAPEAVALEPEVAENATDVSAPGRPSWDVPAFATWNEFGAIDDRPSDMLDAYDEMIPVVTQRVADAQAQASEPPAAAPAPTTEPPPTNEPLSPFTWPSLVETSSTAEVEPAPWSEAVAPEPEPEATPPWLTQRSVGASEPAAPSLSHDPYDADAPVLADVEHASAPVWLDWAPAADVSPVVPSAVGGKILGPTPPADLFAQSEAPATAEPTAEAAKLELAPEFERQPESAPEPKPEPTVEPTPEPAATHVATTTQSVAFSAGPGGQQPLVLRIELAIVDQSIQLRPADMARRVGPWSDEEPVTPRHPEFEPRTHATTTPQVEDEPSTDASLPWAVPNEPQQPDRVDLPWALPALTEPNPTAAWTLEAAPADPLANLPAATFAPPVPATQPVEAPHVEAPHVEAPVDTAPAPQATAVALATVAPAISAPSAPASAAVTSTRPQVNPDQSDLWFLASEPTVEGADGAEAAKTAQGSSMLTVGLTILMGVFVLALAVVFLYMMTSLLR